MDDTVTVERDTAWTAGRQAALASYWTWTRNPHERGTELGAAWEEGYANGAQTKRERDTEWTRRMHERTERLRGVTGDLKQRLWDHSQQIEAEVRAAEPSKVPAPGVIVASPLIPDRYRSYKVIHGPRSAVLAHCSHVFATDHCTPMYEHMLWKLFGADEQPDGTLTLWLSKSDYAGD